MAVLVFVIYIPWAPLNRNDIINDGIPKVVNFQSQWNSITMQFALYVLFLIFLNSTLTFIGQFSCNCILRRTEVITSSMIPSSLLQVLISKGISCVFDQGRRRSADKSYDITSGLKIICARKSAPHLRITRH
jgi:hypothetical protein